MTMETQEISVTATPRSTGIRFGLISAVASIAYFVILNAAQLDMMQGVWSWVGYLIPITIIIFAHKYYKENGNGYMSYGQGLGIAFWIGLISGIVSSIFTYIYIKFIDANFMDMIKDKQLEAMQQKGMSEEQIEQALKFSSMFSSPEVIFIFGFIGAIITTLIIALIVTIFTQKKNPETSI